MKEIIVLLIVLLVFGTICMIGEWIHDSIGLFGPIILIGLLIAFFTNAFKN
jgi:hypothetical protein